MYLFTRRTKLSPGPMAERMEWAVKVTEKVNQITPLNVGLWMSQFSPAVGTISWGAAVESLTDLEDANAKLSVDNMFLDVLNQGADYTNGQLDDQLAQFIHNPAAPDGNPRYVSVVQSQLAAGCFQRGVELGIQIAQVGSEISGVPTAFLIGTTGNYGATAWIAGTETLQALQQGEEAINANAEFIKLVDEVSTCYLPSATTQTIWRRIV